MAIKFNRSQTFATGGTVTSAALHNLVDGTDIYPALITDQSNLATISTADKLLIADTDDTINAKSTTVQNLFDQAFSGGTYTALNLSGGLTFGTATGNRTISTSATITTGTINSATLGTTTGTAATFTNATATGANITNGTVQTLTSSTAIIAGGTFSGSVNSTAGTIATLNSTTGTIGNLSTTLAGDLTISQGTATLGTTGVTAGTYGTNTSAVTLTLDAKGRVTTVSTSAIQATPADGSITPAKLSQPFTIATAVASTSGTAIDFTGIPSWAKKITVMFQGVSTNGASLVLVRLGTSSGFVSSGYLGSANITSVTAGLPVDDRTNSAAVRHGSIQILNLSSNSWVSFGAIGFSDTAGAQASCGSISLSSALTQVRVTTVNGTDTFDAGSINIMYEG